MNGSITVKKESRTCQEVIQSTIQTNQEVHQKTMDTNCPKITECTQFLKTQTRGQPESTQVLHKVHSLEIETVSRKVIHGGITYYYDQPLEKYKGDSNEATITSYPESIVMISSP